MFLKTEFTRLPGGLYLAEATLRDDEGNVLYVAHELWGMNRSRRLAGPYGPDGGGGAGVAHIARMMTLGAGLDRHIEQGGQPEDFLCPPPDGHIVPEQFPDRDPDEEVYLPNGQGPHI